MIFYHICLTYVTYDSNTYCIDVAAAFYLDTAAFYLDTAAFYLDTAAPFFTYTYTYQEVFYSKLYKGHIVKDNVKSTKILDNYRYQVYSHFRVMKHLRKLILHDSASFTYMVTK